MTSRCSWFAVEVEGTRLFSCGKEKHHTLNLFATLPYQSPRALSVRLQRAPRVNTVLHLVILAVHVDNGRWVDVPITPDTKCRDVVECCREPSDELCSLVQTAGLIEQIVPEDTYMMDLLNQWGNNWPAVTFHLQYSDPVENIRTLGKKSISALFVIFLFIRLPVNNSLPSP
ncbi:hypothetical protein AVEN_109348-1 [Araneus ventricosus]|uniref:Ras association domain-containing protein n=1 Tax=Araneus ventricosus TaxID=182803 RepID=A0A4Y2GHX0_ARAVE|nr:hypothetical protein AVEN_109348-1 [Araneus ventricosus]